MGVCGAFKRLSGPWPNFIRLAKTVSLYQSRSQMLISFFHDGKKSALEMEDI
jgi:hypothetical protein